MHTFAFHMQGQVKLYLYFYINKRHGRVRQTRRDYEHVEDPPKKCQQQQKKKKVKIRSGCGLTVPQLKTGHSKRPQLWDHR